MIGFGERYGACTFPGDLDEFDIANGEGFEGVEFGFNSGEEIVLDYQTFYYYLKRVCANYIRSYPETSDELQECIKRYQINFNVN